MDNNKCLKPPTSHIRDSYGIYFILLWHDDHYVYRTPAKLLGRPLHIQVAPCRCLSCTPFLSFRCLDIGEVGLSDPLLSDDEDLKTPRGLGNQVNMVQNGAGG